MKRVFLQYFCRHLRENYQWRSVLTIAVLLASSVIWVTLIVNLISKTTNPIPLPGLVVVVIYLAGCTIAPIMLTVLGAVGYTLTFYRYEPIERAFGYRAFRLSSQQQEYNRAYYDLFPKRKVKIVASTIIDDEGTMWGVMKPGRHHHVVWYMAQHDMNHRYKQKDQGFMTNEGLHLDREAARRLAIENGQALKPDHSRELFSEDLWDTPPHLRYKG